MTLQLIRRAVWTCLALAVVGAAPAVARADAVPELSSPRATMRTFLEAFYLEGGPDLGWAAACLDLREVPTEARGVRGRELAAELKGVIDRTRYVEYEEIPDAAEGPPYVFLRRVEGEVVIERGEDGAWRFTASTLRSLPDLARALASREVVAGVEEAPAAVTPASWLRSIAPRPLRERLFFLEGWQWLGVLIVIVIGVVVDRLLTFLLTGGMVHVIRRRFDDVDVALATAALRPVGMLAMVLVWGAGILWLGLPVGILALYLEAVRVVVTVVAVLTAYRFVDLASDLLAKRASRTASRFDDLLVPLARKTLKVIVVAFGLVFVAENLHQDVSSLIAGLGLGGLAFALAAKDAVSNLFGSVTVLLDRPFQVGDWVKVGDSEGTVEELGFRSTRIRTFYNSLITLPNSNLTNVAVDNLGARRYRRWSTRLGIAYNTPPERIDAFCEGIRELVRRHPFTRKDYYHVYLNDFGADSLEVMVYVFFETPEWATELRERHRLAVDILRLARELGVEFAFPTRTLYLRQEEWSHPEGHRDGYPAGSREFSGSARETAERLVEQSLGGEKPPPVTFPGA